jgi:hypothetical protein
MMFRAPKTVLTLPLFAHLVLALGRMSLGGPIAFAVQALVAVVLWGLLAGIFALVSGLGRPAAPGRDEPAIVFSGAAGLRPGG